MAKLPRECLLCFILAIFTTLVPSYLATSAPDSSVDSKGASKNSVQSLKRLRSRAGQAIQFEDSFANYNPPPAHQYPTPALVSPGIGYPSFHTPSIYSSYYPAPAPAVYHNPHQAPVTPPPYFGQCCRKILPHSQRVDVLHEICWKYGLQGVAENSPVRQIADRTFNAITSVIGITALVPTLILTLILFATFETILKLFPPCRHSDAETSTPIICPERSQ